MKRPKQIKRRRLTKVACIKRMHDIITHVEKNTRTALEAEAAVEAANAIITAQPIERFFYGATCYNTIRRSLSLNFALILARLFDGSAVKKARGRSDCASIPMLVHLLKQQRCRNYLVESARGWTPYLIDGENFQATSCERAIAHAIKVYADLRRGYPGRGALTSLRHFRNNQLAHSLINGNPSAPKYNDLFLLMDAARDFTRYACLAIEGLDHDFADYEKERRREADAFWAPALDPSRDLAL